MIKKFGSLFLISVIFLTAFSPFHAQVQTNEAVKNEASKSAKISGNADLRKVFAQSMNGDSQISLNSKQLEKENLNGARRAKLSKAQKTGLYIGIAAAVVATIVIIVVARGDDDPRANCYVTCTAVGCPPPPPCP